MTKSFIFIAAALLAVSCAEKAPERYTQKSAEIDAVKQSIKYFEEENWESMRALHSDTVSIYENSVTAINFDTYVKNHQESALLYSSREFPDAHEDYEMVTTDKGETWVNFWGQFHGTLKANGEKYVIPVHTTSRFVDGKMVAVYIYYNIAPIAMTLDALERQASEEAEMADAAAN